MCDSCHSDDTFITTRGYIAHTLCVARGKTHPSKLCFRSIMIINVFYNIYERGELVYSTWWGTNSYSVVDA
jgi:hypothetical protein